MTVERFNELLSGALSHPMPQFTMTRLALALKAVVDATGEAGERALEDHCRARQEQDDVADCMCYDYDAREGHQPGCPFA